MISNANHCLKLQEYLGLLTLFVINVLPGIFQMSRVRYLQANALLYSLSKNYILITFYVRRVHLYTMSSRIILQILWFVLAYVLKGCICHEFLPCSIRFAECGLNTEF